MGDAVVATLGAAGPRGWREVGATARRLHRAGEIFHSPTSRSPLLQLAPVTPCGLHSDFKSVSAVLGSLGLRAGDAGG